MFESLWSYTVTSFIMAELGYYAKKDFIKDYSTFTGLNRRTIYRHIKNLLSLGLVTEKKGILYITGKRKAYRKFDISGKASIKFSLDIIKSKELFKKTLIIQCGLYLQKRFRYAYNHLKSNTESLYSKGRIQSPYAFPSNKGDMGVSLSKISEFTGFCKSDVQKNVKGVTRKVNQRGADISKDNFKFMKAFGYFKKNPSISYSYCKRNKTNYLVHSLSSVLECDSLIVRKRS